MVTVMFTIKSSSSLVFKTGNIVVQRILRFNQAAKRHDVYFDAMFCSKKLRYLPICNKVHPSGKLKTCFELLETENSASHLIVYVAAVRTHLTGDAFVPDFSNNASAPDLSNNPSNFQGHFRLM